MAARKTPGSPKPDKLMRDALLIELQTDSDVEERGKKLKKLRLVARSLVTKAIDGDVPAAKEVFERIDGKAAQALDLNVEAALTIELVQFAAKKNG